jgi:3',5'-cyclic AMP phosphodiesterase CpdA
VFKILQLSDIHFLPDAEIDVNAELSDAALTFAREIRSRFGEVDVIVVCGDIAYSGHKEEYARASTFLRNLEVLLGCPRILVVPGNHDIFRVLTETAEQTHLRSSPRRESLVTAERDKALTDILRNTDNGARLLEPLADYLEFADEFGCVVGPNKPFWEVSVPLTPHVEARFRGLTSVLLSDARDNQHRLLLGRVQTASIKSGEPGVFNITVCHHEFDWLLDGGDQKNIIDNRSGLHITGHDHDQKLRKTSSGLHLHSGAMQPDRGEPRWESRINLITIDTENDGQTARSRIEVHAACFEPARDRFVWEEGPPRPFFATTDLRTVPIPAAERAAQIARLRRRLATLTSGDRFQVARESELDLSKLGSLPASGIVAAMIEEAADRNILDRLWVAVERRHGNQEGEGNPFV